MRKRFAFLSLLVLALGLVSVSSFAASQPPGVELNPAGLSRISWMFETPQDGWVNTKSMGAAGHEGDDYYADDWARAATKEFTGEQRTFGQIVYAGISGIAVAKPDHGDYGNDLIIYDSKSKFALRNAHLSEILVDDGEEVSAGSPIGKVGHSGNAQGSHLHIVLYKGVQDVDDRPITWITFNRGDPPKTPGPATDFAAPFLYNPRVKPGETPVTKAEIKVEDAGAVWEAGLTPSGSLVAAAQVVSPRIVVEYADCSSTQGLVGSLELNEAAKPVPPRIIVEYADLCSSQGLQDPDGLEGLARTVSPRIIVEYAEAYFSRNLLRFSATGVGGVTERILSVTSAEVSPDSSVSVYLSITDAAGVAGGDVLIEYDASVITVGEVKSTNLLSGVSLIVNKDVLGEIILSMAGTRGILFGSGVLVEIELTVSAGVKAHTETALKLSGDTELYNELGEAIPVSLEDGVLKIPGICTKGDVNDDGKIRSDDAVLALRIAARLMAPTVQQECAADMNDDGRVRANDAILILRKAAGLAAPSIEIAASVSRQITVALAEVHGITGQTVTVPVKVDSAYGLAGGDICIAYDSAVLRAIDVSSDYGVLLAGNTTEPGMVRIAFASADRLSSETLAEIKFDVLSDDVSPLTLKTVELYHPNALPIDSRKIDGKFTSWAVPPKHSALLQNFPNPFNPDTWIPYQLKEGSEITIRVFSVPGELVRELNLGYKPAGLYVSQDRAAYWDGKNEAGEQAASGVYFYNIRAGGFSAVRKLTVLR